MHLIEIIFYSTASFLAPVGCLSFNPETGGDLSVMQAILVLSAVPAAQCHVDPF